MFNKPKKDNTHANLANITVADIERNWAKQNKQLPIFSSFQLVNLAWLLLSVVVVLVDQYTKQFALSHLSYHEPQVVAPFLNWTLIYNYGVNLGFYSYISGGQNWLFVCLALLVSVVFLVWLMRIRPHHKLLLFSVVLILGGAIGNVFDRIQHGFVIDFIHLHISNFHFPVFNLADIAIAIGVICMVGDMVLYEPKRAKS